MPAGLLPADSLNHLTAFLGIPTRFNPLGSRSKELETSDFGITCITRENMTSPWIHFEAGALAKRMQEGRVIPLLLDVEFKDVSGPLTQFQAKKADREGILGVINAINELSQVKVVESLLPKQFDALWPALEKQINEIQKTQVSVKHQRPQHEVLEELVSSIRGLDVRVRETIEEGPILKRRRGRFHPEMVMDLAHLPEEFTHRRDDHLGILILLSFIREEMPWLYDLGVDAYQQNARGMPGAKQAKQKLLNTLRNLRRGPFLDFMLTKDSYMIFRDIEHFVVMLLERNEDTELKRPRIRTRRVEKGPPPSEEAEDN